LENETLQIQNLHAEIRTVSICAVKIDTGKDLLIHVFAKEAAADHPVKSSIAATDAETPLIVTTDLHEVLRAAIDLSKVSMSKDVKVISNLSNKVPLLNVDKIKLYQLFFNIIVYLAHIKESNAPGEINIATKVGKYKLLISFESIGLNSSADPLNQLEKIFNPNLTKKPILSNHLLGLFHCRELIKQFGGEIHVSAKEGNSLTFGVYFPIQALVAPITKVNSLLAF
jgi:signal transduction histidine kinase